MKELFLEAYQILRRIEELSQYSSEQNKIAIEDLQAKYDKIIELLFGLMQNPIFIRYTKNPEIVKSIVWEKEDKVLDFNQTMNHIFKTIQNGH